MRAGALKTQAGIGVSDRENTDPVKELSKTADNKLMKQKRMKARKKLKKTKVKGNITVTDITKIKHANNS